MQSFDKIVHRNIVLFWSFFSLPLSPLLLVRHFLVGFMSGKMKTLVMRQFQNGNEKGQLLWNLDLWTETTLKIKQKNIKKRANFIVDCCFLRFLPQSQEKRFFFHQTQKFSAWTNVKPLFGGFWSLSSEKNLIPIWKEREREGEKRWRTWHPLSHDKQSQPFLNPLKPISFFGTKEFFFSLSSQIFRV